MPIRTNIAVPGCPAKLPLVGVSPPNDCIPGSVNWNKLVDSQKFIQQAGRIIFEANSQRYNGGTQPVIGFTGNTFFENNGSPVAPETTAEIQRMTSTIELLPSLDKVLLVVNMKLAAIGSMNSQLRIYLVRGAAEILLQSFRAVASGGTFLPGIVTTGAAPYTNAFPGIDISSLLPTPGVTEFAAIRIELRKFNPRGTVTGQGIGYNDGLLHCIVKQYKDCP